MIIYLDTSALLKCYVQEIGSTWMTAQCSSSTGNVLVTALITKAEATAGLAAKQRQGGLSQADHQVAEQYLLDGFTQIYRLITIEPALIDLASVLAKRQGLRGYDAVQLAAGMTLKNLVVQSTLPAPVFISADENLLQAAQNEGLQTDNPNRHP